MCCRYVLETPPEELARYFGARISSGLEVLRLPSYNIAPTTQVLGVAADRDGERVLDVYRWGLVPSWAKDPSAGARTFNARAETVASKPSFRSAFRHRRIAVVADGFWEWRRGAGTSRQPFYLHRADGEPLAFAGLYESWHDVRPGAAPETWLHPCTIITTAASGALVEIHDRMPAILDRSALDVWLDPANDDRDELEALLRPDSAPSLAYYPVARRVGNVRENDRGLLEPVAAEVAPAGPGRGSAGDPAG